MRKAWETYAIFPLPMELAVISVVRNEEDIIESSVRNALRFAEHMSILLHKSTDATASILFRLRAEGLALTITATEEPYHRQGERMTTLMRETVNRFAPQWILPLDADEFPCSSGKAFPDILKTLPRDRVTLLPWRTSIPTPDDDPAVPLPMRLTHRRPSEPEQYSKILIPLALAREEGAAVALGSHALTRNKNGQAYPVYTDHPLWIAHLPVRSEKQLRRKIVLGWEEHRSDPRRRPQEIYQWEHLYERCLDPTPISPEELQKIAMDYAVPSFLTPSSP
ncbi:MAG: glycosyltransferase family 2 protein [Candidatus Peregrinibacteria bacterium]